MTFIANSGTSAPVIDYTSRDYASIYSDLLNRIPNYLPQWTSRSNADFGIVLLQMFAYVGDILGYYMDRIAGEAFMQTATQPQSILNLAAMLNYQPTQSVGAVATLQISISPSTVGPYLIPAGTQFSTLGSSTQAPIIFETDTDLTIAGNNAATPSTIGSVVATQGQTVTSEAVGTSDGSVNQTFQLLQNPVQADGLSVFVDLGYGPVEWNFALHLIDYGPNDNVYTTFIAPNDVMYIVFGDGVNGYVPPLGSPITATYSIGLGSVGNVGANTITQPVTALIGVTAVTNPNAANGGSDPQSLSSIQTNAPAALKSLNRAVTIADFATLALQVPGVQWASAQEATYQLVNLYIAPFGGGSPAGLLVATVQNYFDPLKMANTTVTVLSPTYVGENITVTVVVFSNYKNAVVQTAVQNALTNLLSLANTGFGFRVSLGAVYETILSVPGVNYAIVTSMYRQMLVTLTAQLNSGSPYTSLPCSPLPRAVLAGDSIVLNPGGASTQTLVASGAGALAGATSIPVNSFNANATYSIGTAVQDLTGINDGVFLANEIPTPGTFVLNVSGGI